MLGVFFSHVRFSVVASHIQLTFTDRKLRRHSWTTPTSVLESMLIDSHQSPMKGVEFAVHTYLFIHTSLPTNLFFGQPNPRNCWPRKDQLQHCCQRCSSCWSLAFFLGNLGTLAVKSGWDLNVIHRRNQWMLVSFVLDWKISIAQFGIVHWIGHQKLLDRMENQKVLWLSLRYLRELWLLFILQFRGACCTYHEVHQLEPVVLEVDSAVCVILLLSCCYALIMRANHLATWCGLIPTPQPMVKDPLAWKEHVAGYGIWTKSMNMYLLLET